MTDLQNTWLLTQIILWWHGLLVWKRNDNSSFWLCWCVSQSLRDVEKKKRDRSPGMH